ncbi:cytochrome P450 [Halobacillus yeomjeoni]|uniref:cytochrome P450 n=1 Tax=Halobacillus yeomjeoni TaxID=311194 RepID=UPI001CD59CF8|nr:cytochrome P450 [Halobacillus yeomjeoni]MCA0982934.1 cytochrome P450 [Halobacillus yeomjeoni]
MGQLNSFRKDPLTFLERGLDTGEDVVRFRLANKRVTLIMDPDLIKQVLVVKEDAFQRFKPYKELAPLLGQGLLLSEKPLHKQHRKIVQPSFTPGHILTYGEEMRRKTIDSLREWGKKEKRLLSDDFMSLTLEIIASTMFGADMLDGKEQVGRSLEEAMEIITKRVRSFFKAPKFIKTKENQQFQKAIDTLDEVIMKIILNRKKTGNRSNDLLDALLYSQDSEGHRMSDRQLRDEVMTIFLAGHETTATALTWTMYLLLTHPEAYLKLQAEVDELCREDVPTMEEIKEMTFMRDVFLESMRLYPPAWLINRMPVENIQVGDVGLRTGETIMISPYLMHRHPAYFDNPEKFIPARFKQGKLLNVPDFVYFPFGGGSRICVGKHFAMTESMILLGALIKNFHFTLSDPKYIPEKLPLVTLRMKDGLLVHSERRF